MEKLVRDAMARNVTCCKVDHTVRQVTWLMARYQVHTIVVLDEDAEACGVITATDVIKCYGKNLDQLKAEEVMTPFVITVPPTASLAEAVSLLLSKRIHQLVVPKGDLAGMRPVGIISADDIVREMAK